MKLKQLLFCAPILCILLACGDSSSTENSKETKSTVAEIVIPDGWKTTKTDIFSISHPSEWTADLEGKMGAKLFLFAPPENDEDQFSENINLMTEKLPSKALNLDMYVKASEKQIKQFITDAEIISNKRIKINGKEFQNISYTGKQGEISLHFDQFYTVRDQEAYVLTLTCTVASYEKYKAEGTQIIKTFRLL